MAWEVMVDTKRCPKCGETKPATVQYFSRKTQSKSGITADCRVCRAAGQRLRYAADPMKYEKRRERYARNAEDAKAYSRKWAAEHADHVRAYHVAYYRDHREECDCRAREWCRTHPEQRASAARRQREARLEHHRIRGRAAAARRRARVASSPGRHTAHDVATQYRRQGGRCYWCGKATGDAYHVDHAIPLSRGGSNGPENLVIACARCNLKKYNKLPHEFSGRLC